MLTVADYHPTLASIDRGAPVPVLHQWVRQVPKGRIAAVTRHGVKSYGELQQDTTELARQFLQMGLGDGDVVGVQLANQWEFLVVHAALATVGAVMATLHRPYSPKECQTLLASVDAVAGIVASPNQAGWELSWQRVPRAPRIERPLDSQDPMALFFTSGTHSLSAKACIHSHQSLLTNALTVASEAGMSADDVFISASPFTHLFGILSCHVAWTLGAAQVLVDRFQPADFLQQAAEHGATVAFMVPTHVRDAVRWAQDTRPQFLSRLRLREVRVAGAQLPPELVSDVYRVLGAQVVNHWGMSELGAGTYTHWTEPPEVAARTIGFAARGSRVRIVADHGCDVREMNEVGELWFTGPSLFYGYYASQDVTEAALAVDDQGVWLKTGDLASWDETGRIIYQGRLKDIVNRGGMKINALEVETALSDFSKIAQSALVPVPDARLGERGLLVESLRAGTSLSLDEVRRHLEQKGVARYKWPEYLLVWDSLPTTPTGKIAKARVKERLQAVPLGCSSRDLGVGR